MRQIVDDAEQLLDSAASSGDQRLGAMRRKFETQLRRMRLQLDAFEDSAAHEARLVARATDRAVRDHPYRAVAAAAAIGLLVGVLLARR